MDTSFLPSDLQAKLNIIAIQTGKSQEEVFCASISAGLEMLEDITTRSFAYLKIDDDGTMYGLDNEPLNK